MHPTNQIVLEPTSTDEKNTLMRILETKVLAHDEQLEYRRIIEDEGHTDTMYVIVHTPRLRSMLYRLAAIGWPAE